MTARRPQSRFRQRGATVVEFVLIASVFIALVLGVVQFGWVLYKFNSAAEATRAGARLAVVGAPPVAGNAVPAQVLSAMQFFLPDLVANNVIIEYLPSNADCEYVVVRLATGGDGYPVLLPFWAFWWPYSSPIVLPPFKTALPRESLGRY